MRTCYKDRWNCLIGQFSQPLIIYEKCEKLGKPSSLNTWSEFLFLNSNNHRNTISKTDKYRVFSANHLAHVRKVN